MRLENLLNLLPSKVKIVADGDLDGVTATLILTKHLIEAKREVEVEFPRPEDSNKRSNVLLIERCDRAGVNVICLDHHFEDRKFRVIYVDELGNKKVIYESTVEVDSVFSGVVEFLNVEVPQYVKEVVDLVDSKLPEAIKRYPKVINGYRAIIADNSWKLKAIEMVKVGRDPIEVIKTLFTLFEKVAEKVEEIRKQKIPEISSRVKVIENAAFFEVFYEKEIEKVEVEGFELRIDREQAVMRDVQVELQKMYDPVITIIISSRGLGISVASPNRKIADKIVKKLVEMKIARTGGGRPEIAGAQQITVSVDELIKKIVEIVKSLQ